MTDFWEGTRIPRVAGAKPGNSCPENLPETCETPPRSRVNLVLEAAGVRVRVELSPASDGYMPAQPERE